MTFSLIKKLGATRRDAYEVFDAPTKCSGSPNSRLSSPVTSRTASGTSDAPAGHASESGAPMVDMMSFSDDEDDTPASHIATAARHERTLSDESVTSPALDAPAAKSLRPRRPAPPPPETMEAHLQRLSPAAGAQRSHVADLVLKLADKEWRLDHPMPVTVQHLFVQSFRHVSMENDVAERNAFACTAGVLTPTQRARAFWSVACNTVLEMYMMPRPDASDPARSAFYPQARATIAVENPELNARLLRIEAGDYAASSSDDTVTLI